MMILRKAVRLAGEVAAPDPVDILRPADAESHAFEYLERNHERDE